MIQTAESDKILACIDLARVRTVLCLLPLAACTAPLCAGTVACGRVLCCVCLLGGLVMQVGEIKLININPGGTRGWLAPPHAYHVLTLRSSPNVLPAVGPYEFSIELDQRVYLMKAKTLTDAKRWVNVRSRWWLGLRPATACSPTTAQGLNEIQERCRPHRRRPRSAGAGGGKAGSARPATVSVDRYDCDVPRWHCASYCGYSSSGVVVVVVAVALPVGGFSLRVSHALNILGDASISSSQLKGTRSISSSLAF